MKKSLFAVGALSLVLGLGTAVSAQDTMMKKGQAAKPAKAQKMTLTGNIVDKACSAKVSKAADVQVAAGDHKKGCALSDGCAKSGYGVFADGKYYEFDEAGNTMAKDALTKSTAEKGAKFNVEGKVTDNQMVVAKITEVK